MTVGQVKKSSLLAQPETDLLLSFLLGKSREFILTHPEKNINPSTLRKLQSAEKKRLTGWPIAYLTGRKEFYGLDFRVSPAVLVPRPESELLVEYAIEAAQKKEKPLIIDVGTGSGAIIISLARELKKIAPKVFRSASFSAIDISSDALAVARENAKRRRLDKKISFYRGDLLSPLKNKLNDKDLIITANLPYLTPAQIKNSPTISREPRLALDGGPDGLKYYRRLFGQLAKSKCRSLSLACEIDPSQARAICRLAKILKGDIEIQKDLAGRKRVLIIKK